MNTNKHELLLELLLKEEVYHVTTCRPVRSFYASIILY